MKPEILLSVEEFAKQNKMSRSKLTAFAQNIIALHAPSKPSGRKASDATMQHRQAIGAWVEANKGKEFTTEDIVQAVGCHKAEANNALKRLPNVQVIGTMSNSGKRGRKPQIFKCL